MSLFSFRRMAVVLVAMVVAVLGPAETASAANTYTLKAFGCVKNAPYARGNVVNANMPTMTASNSGTNVYWNAYLYRYTSSGWVLYAKSGWNNGVGYSSGSGHWVNSGGVDITFFQFHNLPAGSYEVLNYLQWQDGSTANGWSWYNASSWFCTF